MKTRRLALFGLSALLAGCALSPDDRIARDPRAFAMLPSAVQARVRRGQIDVGDNETAVRLALGKPARRFTRRDATGATEVWVYGRSGPWFSFGFGVSGGSRHTAVGVGVGATMPRPHDSVDGAMRVEFQQGRVVRVDYRKG